MERVGVLLQWHSHTLSVLSETSRGISANMWVGQCASYWWRRFGSGNLIYVYIHGYHVLILNAFHDDIMKWKHFPCYWTFVRLNKQLRKQSWGWGSETPSRSLWRHCSGNIIVRTTRRHWSPVSPPDWISCTARCRYNVVNFLKNIHERHIAREVWGVFCWFSPDWYSASDSCNDICNMLIY